MAVFQDFLVKKIINSICKTIFYDKSLQYREDYADFVIAQINKSPLHIRLALNVLTLIFAVMGFFGGFVSKSYDKKIRFIGIFERLCKTTRMYISFIRSMSFIYACDNNLL